MLDFWKAVLELIRRKLPIISLLGAALVVALVGYFLVPLKYVSSTMMVLITPAAGGTLSRDPTAPPDLTNPMLSFSNDLKTASTILIQVMNTPEVAAKLGAVEDGPTQVTINDGRTNPNLLDGDGPFIYVVGESTSAADAKDVVVRAQRRMRQELLDRQKSLGAPPETYLTMVDVVPTTIPKISRSDNIKVGGVAFVLSLVFGLGIAYVWRAGKLASKKRESEVGSGSDWELRDSVDGGSGEAVAAEQLVVEQLADVDPEQEADAEQLVVVGQPADGEQVAESEQDIEAEHLAEEEEGGRG